MTSPEAVNVFAKAWADAGKPEGLNIEPWRRDDESVADEGGDEVGETVAVETLGEVLAEDCHWI